MCFTFTFLHRHFLMTLPARLKKLFRFFEIFKIPLKDASNFILRWFPSQTISMWFLQSSKCVLQNSIGHLLLYLRYYACLGKLWVSNTYHLPKILIFSQLPPKLFLWYPYLDMNDCFCHTSTETFLLPLRGFHLHLKQWIFFYLSAGSQNYSCDKFCFVISVEKILSCSRSKSELFDRQSLI